jgi:hypothetical protein
MKKPEEPISLPAPAATCSPEAVRTALDAFLAGKSVHEVTSEVRAQFPAENADEVLLCAADEMAQASRMDPETVVGWSVLATRDIYKKSLEAKNLPVALAAVKAIYSMTRR